MNWSRLSDRHSVRLCLLAVVGFTLFACTVAAQVLPPGPAVTVFLPTQNVSNSPGASYSQQMAIDSQGNINLVWDDDSPGYTAVFFSRSTDGGVTFSAPQNLSNDPGGSIAPKIVVDSAGNIYVVWAGRSTNNGYITRSSDGSNFSTPVRISDSIRETPSIAIGPDGRVYVGWQDTSFFHSAFFSQSSDGGVTFSAPILLSTLNSFGGTPLFGLDVAGNIDVIWNGCFYSSCPTWFSRSIDGGTTFSPQLRIATEYEGFGLPATIALGPEGDINLVFNTGPYGNIFLVRSIDAGVSFTTINVSKNPRESTSSFGAQLAVDSADNLNIIWVDNNASGITFARSNDGGGSFSIQSIAEAGSEPQIAVASYDAINLVWSGPNGVMFSRSSDGGSTFSAPQQLSNNAGANAPPPMPQIALDSMGNAYVTWVDYSPGNADIFFTRGVTLQLP